MDMISNLPSQIIETILCLVTIKEAARTSILSKEWRYKWTKIPKVVINEGTFYASDQTSITHQPINAIYQILLNHQGPMHEFTLSVKGGDIGKRRLPLSLLPMDQLKDLYLSWCYLPCEPTFDGISSLTRLHVLGVRTSTKLLLHLLSNCPLLKSLSLISLPRQFMGIDEIPLIDLLNCLPVIENLTIILHGIMFPAECGAQDKLPTALVNLKYLCVRHLCFVDVFDNFASLAFIMRSSPNLEKLHIHMVNYMTLKNPEVGSFTVESHSDILPEHLNELEITNLSNMKRELDFVKFVLAKSSELKRLKILLFYKVDKDVEFQISRMLLSSPRASPGVEITVSLLTVE